jgi:hypothetical protein
MLWWTSSALAVHNDTGVSERDHASHGAGDRCLEDGAARAAHHAPGADGRSGTPACLRTRGSAAAPLGAEEQWRTLPEPDSF